ncbi:hypothetical protein ACI2TO_22805 [Ralstonia nicotianae]
MTMNKLGVLVGVCAAFSACGTIVPAGSGDINNFALSTGITSGIEGAVSGSGPHPDGGGCVHTCRRIPSEDH